MRRNPGLSRRRGRGRRLRHHLWRWTSILCLPNKVCEVDAFKFECLTKCLLILARKMQLQMQIDDIVKKNKTHRPKKRKGADEDALDRFADEEVSQLREEMLKAAAEDDDANKDKLPATAKLRLLDRVKEVLQKCVASLYD